MSMKINVISSQKKYLAGILNNIASMLMATSNKRIFLKLEVDFNPDEKD